MTEFTVRHSAQGGPMRYLRAIWRHWQLIALMAVIAVASAAYFSYTADKQYKASADLLITPVAASDDSYEGFASIFRQTFEDSSSVVTATRIISSRLYYRDAFASLGDDATGASVSVQPLGQANIVTIKSTARDPEQAMRVANAYARYVVSERTRLFEKELQRRIKLLRRQANAFPKDQRAGNFEYLGLQQKLAEFLTVSGTVNPTIQTLALANIPGAPSWPRPRLSILAALLAAVLVGASIALLLEFASPRITSDEDLQLEHRLPILARIPRVPNRLVRAYLTGKAQLPSPVWKGYRVLRSVLGSLGPDGNQPRSILVTSASPGDAKTTTAVNLAITLAASNLRVILVDGDLHRPMVSTVFNLPTGRSGLSRVLASRVAPDQAIVPAPNHPRLKLLLSNPEEYAQLGLRSDRFRRLIDELTELADVVVVDSPPVPEVAEVLEMATAVDAVIVCVRLGHTRRDKLIELREMLGRRDVTPVGFVVTTRERVRRETEYDYQSDLQSHAPSVTPIEEPRRRASARSTPTAAGDYPR
jgi:capsular exopolysaccharide synthesis family protein